MNTTKPQVIIYLDDFLCTGETVVTGLTDKTSGWLNQRHISGVSNYEYLINAKATMYLFYLAIHTRAAWKIPGRIFFNNNERNIPKEQLQIIQSEKFQVQNDLKTPGQSLNFLFPSEVIINDDILLWQQEIEDKIVSYYPKLNGTKIEYRKKGEPQNETLFSSADNRDRYERIMLYKNMEYYQYLKHKDTVRPRPLGYGQNTYVDFGLGTMLFSWRNVPYNAPLVFWYPYTDNTPLFERVFTG
jgi:hypothetical protein